MTVNVRMPVALLPLTDGSRDVRASGATVGEVLASVDAQYPGFSDRLLDASGLRRYLNVFLGGSDIRFLDGLATPVPDGATLTILPAVAGG